MSDYWLGNYILKLQTPSILSEVSHSDLLHQPPTELLTLRTCYLTINLNKVNLKGFICRRRQSKYAFLCEMQVEFIQNIYIYCELLT
jgi:hypothetical protein